MKRKLGLLLLFILLLGVFLGLPESGGFPRTINNITVASLMYATVRKMLVVDEEAVYQANIETGI